MSDTSGDGCAFCQIVAGESSDSVIFDDEVSLVFLDHRPLLRGHCLLVPKHHVETFHDLPATLIAPLFTNAQLIARAVERGMQADGTFLAINTRVSQSVPHLHIHVVPRWKKDGLFSKILIWRRRPYRSEREMAEIKHAIQTAINDLRTEHTQPGA
ncbi:MAG TPA: HIT family protein [Nitrospiria bacterium]|nr:HIT family protein [Nitrospiria bacterium]